MTYTFEHSHDETTFISSMHKGDERTLKSLFSRFRPGLVYFSMQYLNNSMASEDIVAESFHKTWNRRRDFESLPAIKSFLYTTVRNACLNQLKQTNRYAACHEEIRYLSEKSEEIFSEQTMIKAEILNTIWKNVEELPPVRQKIFKMMFKDGLNSFEIARILKISVDTVRVQKARALNALRLLIKSKV